MLRFLSIRCLEPRVLLIAKNIIPYRIYPIQPAHFVLCVNYKSQNCIDEMLFRRIHSAVARAADDSEAERGQLTASIKKAPVSNRLNTGGVRQQKLMIRIYLRLMIAQVFMSTTFSLLYFRFPSPRDTLPLCAGRPRFLSPAEDRTTSDRYTASWYLPPRSVSGSPV